MLNLDEIYFAEYSVTQGCFHIETAREAMRQNLHQIVNGWTNSYLPFAVCGSRAEANRACDVLTKAMLKHGTKTGGSGVTALVPAETDPEPVEVNS